MTRTKVRPRPTLFAVVLFASLMLGAPAAGAKDKEASFKLEVSGEQHSTWTSDNSSPGCGGGSVHVFGSGNQSFSFTTKKPVKVKLYYTKTDDGSSAFFDTGDGIVSTVPVNVASLREGKLTVEQVGGSSCSDGGDGEVPPADCGARSFPALIGIDYYTPETFPDFELTPLAPVMSLSGPLDETGLFGRSLFNSLYENCPASGTYGFELLLSTQGALSPKLAFGQKERFKVKVKDREVFDGSGVHEETDMNWKMRFTRRGK